MLGRVLEGVLCLVLPFLGAWWFHITELLAGRYSAAIIKWQTISRSSRCDSLIGMNTPSSERIAAGIYLCALARPWFPVDCSATRFRGRRPPLRSTPLLISCVDQSTSTSPTVKEGELQSVGYGSRADGAACGEFGRGEW
ncbi:hypothetical protein OE88DRAFT_1099932 [Heliocybe sulcata]|uniref:Uncharacterized protein n=1 Tax=Heliocybe sulcata TaxID=5364 RepID=A0A5C3MM76_9AGAM|nr:hypothetical protein OE88DRAFT_1099932 [Heliocybe sulcata]